MNGLVAYMNVTLRVSDVAVIGDGICSCNLN